MFRRKLCPRCKTGKECYELDSRATECPYMCYHNGKMCSMYVPIKSVKKNGCLRCFFNKR